MVFCNSDWKFFNLRSPSGGSRSVDAFPTEWEAADPIKQAAERRALWKKRRHSTEHPAPEGERDGVSERFVLRRVRFLVYAAFLVRPVADTDPSVRIPLKPCAFQWGKPTNDHALHNVLLCPAARMSLQRSELVYVSVFLVVDAYYKIRSVFGISLFAGRNDFRLFIVSKPLHRKRTGYLVSASPHSRLQRRGHISALAYHVICVAHVQDAHTALIFARVWRRCIKRFCYVNQSAPAVRVFTLHRI